VRTKELIYVLAREEVAEMARKIIGECTETTVATREKLFVVALPSNQEYDKLLSERLWPIALSRAKGVKLPARIAITVPDGVELAMTFGSVDEMRDAEKFEKWLKLATRRKRSDADSGVGKVLLMKAYEKFYADPKPAAKPQ
jgi:hypothetical protein